MLSVYSFKNYLRQSVSAIGMENEVIGKYRKMTIFDSYSVFQGFSKAKSANGGSILSSSQFLIQLQLPQKIKLASKVVKVD